MELMRFLRRRIGRTQPLVDLRTIIKWNLDQTDEGIDPSSVDLSSTQAEYSDVDQFVDREERQEVNQYYPAAPPRDGKQLAAFKQLHPLAL